MSETIVGSVGVQLVPSAEGFRERTRGLLEGLTVDVGLSLDDALARAELDELTRTRTATIQADADTAAAELQLDALARDRHANIDVDSRGLGVAAAQGSAFNGILQAAIVSAAILGPALVPIGAAVAGVGAFAGVAFAAVKSLEGKQKEINKLRDKGTKESLAQAKALESTIAGPQRRFLAAQAAVGDAFDKLLRKAGPAVFAPLAAGLNLLADILPKLAPLVTAVSDVLTDLIDHLDKGVKGGGFEKFLDYVIGVMPTVTAFLGSLGQMLGNLFVGLAPAGEVILGVLTQVFGYLATVPPDVLAPLAVALVGLFGGPWVALIAGAAVAFENLYTKSAPVREAVSEIATSVKGNLQPVIAGLVDLWKNHLVPALEEVGPPLAVIATGLLTLALKALPPLLKLAGFLIDGLVPAFKLVTRIWLTVVGGIVNGAAKAFGWIPGIGGKLKKAADGFNHFRDEVNNALAGIKDRVVHVSVKVNGPAGAHQAAVQAALNDYNGYEPKRRALGGPIDPRKIYIVGENGPELFVSGVAGRIIPNDKIKPQIGTAAHSGGLPMIGTAISAALGPVSSLASAIRATSQEIEHLKRYLDNHDKLSKAERRRLELDQKRLEKKLDKLNAARDAIKAFDVSSVLPIADPKNPVWTGVKKALNQFQHDFTKAGGKWNGALQDQAHGMLANALAIDKATHKLNDSGGLNDKLAEAAQRLNDLQQQAESLKSTAAGNFGGGLFEIPTEWQGVGLPPVLQPFDRNLDEQIAGVTSAIDDFQKLLEEGVDGGLLQALVSNGEAGLATLHALAGAEPGQVSGLADKFAQLTGLSGQFGDLVSKGVFGGDIAAAQADKNALQAQVDETNKNIQSLVAAVRAEQAAIKAEARRPAHYTLTLPNGKVLWELVVDENKKNTDRTHHNALAGS